MLNGKQKHLGYFDSLQEAKEAYESNLNEDILDDENDDGGVFRD